MLCSPEHAGDLSQHAGVIFDIDAQVKPAGRLGVLARRDAWPCGSTTAPACGT